MIRIIQCFFIWNIFIYWRISKQNLLENCPVKNDPSSQYSLLIDGFSRFNQLNFSLCREPIVSLRLYFKPERNTILSSSYDLTGLVVNPVFHFFIIQFSNINGIDIAANPSNGLEFTDLNFSNDNLMVNIEKSNLKFFYNGKLSDRSSCDLNIFVWTKKTFMNSIRNLFLFSMTSEMLCPILFLKSNLKLLSISPISSSLIEKRCFSFETLHNQTDEIDIDSKIFQFIISVYRVDLNENLLSPLVFRQLKILDINGQLNSIENDLFKSLKQLKMLRFRSQNIKKLFSRQNEWLNYLNYHVYVDSYNPYDLSGQHRDSILFLILFQIYSNVEYYDYPDKDFCYFKNFPHKRLVLPQLKPVSKSSCSCTELFLIHKLVDFSVDRHIYDTKLLTDYNLPPHSYDDDIYDFRFSICLEQDIHSMIDKCEFEKRLNNCNLAQGI